MSGMYASGDLTAGTTRSCSETQRESQLHTRSKASGLTQHVGGSVGTVLITIMKIYTGVYPIVRAQRETLRLYTIQCQPSQRLLALVRVSNSLRATFRSARKELEDVGLRRLCALASGLRALSMYAPIWNPANAKPSENASLVLWKLQHISAIPRA